MLNVLYSSTPPGGNYTRDMIPTALNNVMDFFIYLSGNVVPDAWKIEGIADCSG